MTKSKPTIGAKLDVHFKDDATGQCVNTLTIQRADMTAAEIIADLNEHKPAGQTLTFPEQGHVCADLPPDPLQSKRDRLQVLRAKGWASLTVLEKDEVTGLKFDLGL